MEEMNLPTAIWIGAVPDSFGGFSRDLALDVHDRRRTGRGDVARGGARVFLLSLDADDVCRDRLRSAEDDQAPRDAPDATRAR